MRDPHNRVARARRISVGKYMKFTRAESSTDTGSGLFAGR